MSVTVAMMIGSTRSTTDLVRTSLESIRRNIGDNPFFYIGVAPEVGQDIRKYLQYFMEQGIAYKIIFDYPGTWAELMNDATQESTGKWFLVTHDDVQLHSPDLISCVERILGTKEDTTGWITFTDNDYLNGHWAPCVREGWHIDLIRENAWGKKKLHQFHACPDDWFDPKKSSEYFWGLPYDFPVRPVKCHSPFSHFNLIRLDTLKKIGPCEKWGKISLLVDEDWGLEALRHNYFNVWIPSLVYTHRRMGDGTRAFKYNDKAEEIKGEAERKLVHEQFRKKWGFDANVLPKNIEEAKKRYAGTNVFWSLDKRSYEWDYL